MKGITFVLTILFLLCGCSKSPQPPVFSDAQIMAAMQRADSQFQIATIGPTDEQMAAVNEDWLRLMRMKMGPRAYRRGDCDNYAFRAAGLARSPEFLIRGYDPAFGIRTVNLLKGGCLGMPLDSKGPHALNFYISPDLDVWIFEPQTGQSARLAELLEQGYLTDAAGML
ncbi:MAG TPA: hypothetical protein VEH27_00700 [Methylomirabilota bacterium]|nr:hypothetical protein [Methylomirabilota bacterium]